MWQGAHPRRANPLPVKPWCFTMFFSGSMTMWNTMFFAGHTIMCHPCSLLKSSWRLRKKGIWHRPTVRFGQSKSNPPTFQTSSNT
jgi:hypothetical protein